MRARIRHVVDIHVDALAPYLAFNNIVALDFKSLSVGLGFEAILQYFPRSGILRIVVTSRPSVSQHGSFGVVINRKQISQVALRVAWDT